MLEYQFDLEVVCKKRELLLIDSRIRNAEGMLKQISEGSTEPPAEPEESEADFEDDKKTNHPILYARRKDGQFVRSVPSSSMLSCFCSLVILLYCGRVKSPASKVPSPQAVNHLARVHRLRFASTEDAIGACGKVSAVLCSPFCCLYDDIGRARVGGSSR